jgi:hypothetical protein
MWMKDQKATLAVIALIMEASLAGAFNKQGRTTANWASAFVFWISSNEAQ